MSRVRAGADSDLHTLRELWSLCFPEDEEFNEFFFSVMYKPNIVRIIEEEGHIAAALYVFTYSIALPECGELKAWYIYGVGTHPDFRGRGLAGELIKFTLAEAREKEIDACMLVPQNEGLFEFYKRFDFLPAFFFRQEMYKDVGTPKSNLYQAEFKDIASLDYLYEKCLENRAHVKRSEREWQLLLTEFDMAGGGIYILAECGRICAYCTCSREYGELTVREVFAKNEAYKNTLLSRICVNYDVKELKMFVLGKGEPYGSVYPISRAAKQIDFLSAYMNLMHS